MKINGRNPIWVVLSIILIVIGIAGALISPLTLTIALAGGLFLLLQLSKNHIIKLSSTGFQYNTFDYTFSDLKKLHVTVQTTDVTMHITGSYNQTYIKAIDINGKEAIFGKSLIEEYQKCLVFIIHQFWINNEEFIANHFKGK